MTYVPSKNPVMLAKHLHKVPESKRVFPAFASTKYDGVYAYGMPDGRIFSRTGKECFSLQHISEQLRDAEDTASRDGLMPHVLIFEVYTEGWNVKDISGAFRRRTEQYTEAVIMVHDAIPAYDFIDGVCSTPYKYRMDIVQYFVGNIPSAVLVAQTYILTEEAALNEAASLIAAGAEGIILRNPNGAWVAGKRNEDLVKIKQEETLDLRVVNVIGGKGKYVEVAGTIGVDFNGGVQQISGMSDKERLMWALNPALIVNKIVEVQFMCFTPDGWMREPRFKMIRYDKTQADNEGVNE